jgi:hypothetical protein
LSVLLVIDLGRMTCVLSIKDERIRVKECQRIPICEVSPYCIASIVPQIRIRLLWVFGLNEVLTPYVLTYIVLVLVLFIHSEHKKYVAVLVVHCSTSTLLLVPVFSIHHHYVLSVFVQNSILNTDTEIFLYTKNEPFEHSICQDNVGFQCYRFQH